MVRVVGDCSGHCGVRSARRVIIGSAHMLLSCCESPARVEHVVVFFSFLLDVPICMHCVYHGR